MQLLLLLIAIIDFFITTALALLGVRYDD